VYVLNESDNGISYVYTADSQRVRSLRLEEDMLCKLRRSHFYHMCP
jgi:hypothetical protein